MTMALRPTVLTELFAKFRHDADEAQKGASVMLGAMEEVT
jgi:hypothetical protein